MWHDGRGGLDLYRAVATRHDGIRPVLGIPIGPEHAIAMDDEQFVTGKIPGVQECDFIGEVDGDAGVAADRLPQTGADVVGVVITVARSANGPSLRKRPPAV